MSTNTFPSNGTIKEAKTQEDVMDAVFANTPQKKAAAPAQVPAKPVKVKEARNDEDVMNALFDVKKKVGGEESSPTELPSKSAPPSPVEISAASSAYTNKNVTPQDLTVLGETDFGKGMGFNTFSPAQKNLYAEAHNGTTKADMVSGLNKDIFDVYYPTTQDPKLNQRRMDIKKKVLLGTQDDIQQVKGGIIQDLNKKIDQINSQASPSDTPLGARTYAYNPVQQQQVDALKSQIKKVSGTMDDWGMVALVNSPEAKPFIEMDKNHPQLLTSVAALKLGEQIEKTYGLNNTSGNLDYERSKIGMANIIRNSVMEYNDLAKRALTTKDPEIAKAANEKLTDINRYQNWYNDLDTKQYTDVGAANTARFLGDIMSETNPKRWIVTKQDVADAAKVAEERNPGWFDKYGKFISTIQEHTALVPHSGFGGAIERGSANAISGALKFRADIFGYDEDKQQLENASSAPVMKGTSNSGAYPTKIVFDTEGKAYREKDNEHYGQMDWNNGVRYIGESLPGLLSWVAAEESGAGYLKALGAGKNVSRAAGLLTASAITGFDSNKKLADQLIPEKDGTAEAKKNIMATLLTISTAAVFKALDYSPAKFIENSVSKSASTDAFSILEKAGWDKLDEKQTYNFLKDNILPRAKAVAKQFGENVKGGVKLGAASVLDQKLRDVAGAIVNPDNATPSSIQENMKTFVEQAVMMGGVVGLPGMVKRGFDSPFVNDALYSAGSYAPQYIDRVNDMVTRGQMDQKSANQAIAVLKTIAEEVSKASGQTDDLGLPLTTRARKKMAIDGFRERAAEMLQKQGMDVPRGTSDAKADKDAEADQAYIPVEDSSTFKSIKPQDAATPPPKSFSDIDPSKTYTYVKEGEEVTETGAQIIDHMQNGDISDPKEIKITSRDWNDLADEKGFVDITQVANKLGKDFKDGQPIEFFAEKKRTGTWDKKRGLIVDDEGKPWGMTAILNDKQGYVKSIDSKKEPPNETHLKISYDAKTALEKGNKKLEVVQGEDGKPVVKEVEFTKEDASLELDRMEALAKKGKLTPEEFQKSYFGQQTDTTTFSEAKKSIVADPVKFIADLRKSFEGENPTDQETKATDVVNKALEAKEIEGVYADQAKKNPLGFIKEIADQITGTNADGVRSLQPDAERATREQFGDAVVDAAKELFPPDQSKTKPTVILPGENKSPNIIPLKEPNVKVIQPKDNKPPNIVPLEPTAPDVLPSTEHPAEPIKEKTINKDTTEDFVTKTGNQKVVKGKDGLKVVDTKSGEPVAKKTEKKALQEYADNFDYTHGEKAPEPSEEHRFADEKEGKRYMVESSNNPAELAAVYIDEEPVEQNMTPVERMIADYGFGTNGKSYNDFGDRNNMTMSKARAYLNKKHPSLDVSAKEMSDHYGVDITPHDLVEFMDRFPNGVAQALKTVESDIAIQAKEKFKSLTGLDLTRDVAAKAIDQDFNKLDELNQHLLNESHENEQQLTDAHFRAVEEKSRSAEEKSKTGTPEQPGSKKNISEDGGKGQPPTEPPPVTEEEKEPEPPAVGIFNAAVDERRLNVGLKQVVKEARRSFEDTWDEAREKVQAGLDPRSFVAALHADIKNVPRQKFNEVDNAIILMDRIDLTNQKDAVMEELQKAAQSSNDNLEALAWQKLQDVEQKLQQNDVVADKVGTALGRALSSRRLLAYQDYSLAKMKADVGKYYPDHEVPPEVAERLATIEKEHAEALKKLQEYEDKWKNQQAAAKYKAEKPKKEKSDTGEKKLPKEKKIKLAGKDLADKIRKLRPGSDAAQANVFGLPVAIYDTAIVTIANAVEKGAELAQAIKDGVDYIRENNPFANEKDEKDFIAHLSALDEEPKKSVRDRSLEKISALAKNNPDHLTKDMITPIRRLFNDYAKNGIEEFPEALDKVYNDIKGDFRNLDINDVRDAYSGYGEIKLDTKKEMEGKIRGWKQEATLLGQMDDVIAGMTPDRRVVEKSKPSEKITRMRKELQQAMKDQGIEWDKPPVDIAEKNARALKSLKTRLQNEIDNVINAIENKNDLPEKRKTAMDHETRELMQQKKELTDILNYVLGKDEKKTLSDADKIERTQKYLDKQIGEISKDIDDIKSGSYKAKTKSETPQGTPEQQINLEFARGRRDALKELKRKLIVDTSPKSSEPKIALEKYKDNIRNRIFEFQRRIEEKDFEVAEDKKSFQNDAEAHNLEVELKRSETAFKQEKSVAEKKNKNALQKIYDKINAWKRFSVLTGIPTIGKLGTAVLYRNVVSPIEEIAGTVLKFTVPGIYQVAKQAPREGGNFSFKAEGSALKEWAKAKSYKDAVDVLKHGQSELDHQFGKYVSMPPEALEVMGRVHASMKNFAKRSEYARSYEKRMQHAIDHGADPSDSLTQLTAMSGAYIDANRSIFMQDNGLVKRYNNMLRELENSGNAPAQTTAAVLKFLLPIIKIPTNFVGESLNYAFGSARVLEIAGRALTGHLNDMTPEQADGLMRSIKKGSLGVTAMAMGFFMPGLAGGYYVRGMKKKEGEPEQQELEIAGIRIPSWATHFPLFEAIQLGSTMRKIVDRDINKGEEESAAIGDGIIKSARGLIGEVPLFHAPEELTEAIEGGDLMNKFVYPEMASMIPIVSQWAANRLDVDEDAESVNYFGIPYRPAVKRSPDGLMEHIEYRLPGLRQYVETTDDFKMNHKLERKRRKEEASGGGAGGDY